MMFEAYFSFEPSTCQLGVMAEMELLDKVREFQDMKWGKDQSENIYILFFLLVVCILIFILIYTGRCEKIPVHVHIHKLSKLEK